MTDAKGQGQADKAAAEKRTADEAGSAAAKVLNDDSGDSAVNPYPAYDFMTLDQLRELAKERGVEMNRDVEKAHLITELRAADTHL